MILFDQVRLFCATAAHEANRIYCRALGDLSQVEWDVAPEWQRESALKGVDGVFAGNGPGASHEGWLKEKVDTGWVYGETKDPVAKTHPCMVPFDQLPADQQNKDVLFVSTVRMMASVLGAADMLPAWKPEFGMQMADSLKVTTRPA